MSGARGTPIVDYCSVRASRQVDEGASYSGLGHGVTKCVRGQRLDPRVRVSGESRAPDCVLAGVVHGSCQALCHRQPFVKADRFVAANYLVLRAAYSYSTTSITSG